MTFLCCCRIWTHKEKIIKCFRRISAAMFIRLPSGPIIRSIFKNINYLIVYLLLGQKTEVLTPKENVSNQTQVLCSELSSILYLELSCVNYTSCFIFCSGHIKLFNLVHAASLSSSLYINWGSHFYSWIWNLEQSDPSWNWMRSYEKLSVRLIIIIGMLRFPTVHCMWLFFICET